MMALLYPDVDAAISLSFPGCY